jgi:hypothetical protein
MQERGDDERGYDENGDRPASSDFHPVVNLVIVGLVVWFVLAAWAGFSRGRQVDYLLVIVSGLFTVAVAIPTMLWRAASRERAHDRASGHEPAPARQSLRDWWQADFDTWQAHLTGGSAAFQALLPLAAAAIGMTLFALDIYLVAGAG